MKRLERNKLKKLLHQAVVGKYGKKCLRCGKVGIQASHIYPKGVYKDMEWDIENLKPLCFRCHLEFWHKNPIEAHEWLKTVISAKRLASLKKKAQQNNGLKPYYNYEDIKKQLEKYVKKID